MFIHQNTAHSTNRNPAVALITRLENDDALFLSRDAHYVYLNFADSSKPANQSTIEIPNVVWDKLVGLLPKLSGVPDLDKMTEDNTAILVLGEKDTAN
jgi:hypothetical protein